MKEHMLDVLMYLFENYMGKNCDINVPKSDLLVELEQAGFDYQEITSALTWLNDLDNLSKEGKDLPTQKHASRVFAQLEMEKLGVNGCGFIYFLEETGVLNPLTRELVIDRAFALDEDEVPLSRLKWVALMVLFNSGDKEAELAWLEDFIFNGTNTRLN